MPDDLAVHELLPQAPGHHGDAFDGPSCRSDSCPGAIGDSLLAGELFRNFDEETWLQLVQLVRVMRPVVVHLREPVGAADDRGLIRCTVNVLVGVEADRT